MLTLAATPKTVMTTLEPVTFRRARYRNGACSTSLAPVDESLGLVDDYLTRPAAQLGLMMGHCTARQANAPCGAARTVPCPSAHQMSSRTPCTGTGEDRAPCHATPPRRRVRQNRRHLLALRRRQLIDTREPAPKPIVIHLSDLQPKSGASLPQCLRIRN